MKGYSRFFSRLFMVPTLLTSFGPFWSSLTIRLSSGGSKIMTLAREVAEDKLRNISVQLLGGLTEMEGGAEQF